ncbi:hypothetical protein AB4Y85_06820 [Microvirga sp. 2YAF29]|uniref:hypothetical protein n=1 Tax=Microvirga sp. 2YAF29 TaxID=3233031 RepID=UPI003F94A219
MSRYTGFVIFLVLTSSWTSVAAEERHRICGKSLTSLERILEEIERQPGIERQPNNQNIDVLIDKRNLIIWNFYRDPHPAAPTVVCTRTVQGADKSWSKVHRIMCGAAKPICDALKASYDELDRNMRRTLEGQ